MVTEKKKIEILAPAGGEEQLTAAVRSGADAVYFGASSFNARRNAQNFTDEQFLAAVKYCRERGVKAYITLNTIFKDSEKEEFLKTLKLIAKSGADAVILQDMGAVKLVKEHCPAIPMHASTQMAVHNVSGARLLEAAGFSRVVLARELSFNEIKKITETIGIETEMFVHGAHCMSVSGMCYMSSFLGARSGNRGLCAQPCRLNFKSGKREYALSLKDMCLIDETDRIIEAGVTSLKIEGRMKRPEYVASAVSAYKNAVNGKSTDVSVLQSVFSRSGFTKGYFEGKRDISMFGYRTKEDVLSASSSVLSSISNTYRNENPLVPVSINFTLSEGECAELCVSDGENTVTVTGDIPEKAEKVALSEEAAVKNLTKLGSTFYYAQNVSCKIDGGLMMRAADINALRREATDRLTEIRGASDGYAFSDIPPRVVSSVNPTEPEIFLMFRSASLIPDKITCDKLILPLNEISDDIIEKWGGKLCALIPSLVYPEKERECFDRLCSLREKGIDFAYCENIGAVALAKKASMKIMGGALLNVLNSDALRAYRAMGVSHVTLSGEISFKELKSISSTIRTGLTVYGYMPLMHFRCCPLKGENGCGKCMGNGEITDRMGEKFRVLCENRQYSVLYNTVPLYLGDKKLPPVSYVLLKFTEESPEAVTKIVDAYINKKALAGRKTAGLTERELI